MTASKNDTIDLFVCVDCGFQLAYGDVENPDPRWNPDAFARKWDGYVVVNGDSDKDRDFSWSSCDGCGSTFGGARMHCVAWEMEAVK
jgi:hypothetical protein